MRRLSFSSLALAEACPASHVLPGIEQDTPQAVAGTEVHRQIADWLDGTGDLMPYHVQTSAAIRWLMEVSQHGILEACAAEVPYALNWQTGEVRRLDVRDRQYPDLGEGWIYGTVDLVAPGLVLDWKPSYPPGSLGPPGQALQLLAAGYCVAYLAAVDSADVAVAYGMVDTLEEAESRLMKNGPATPISLAYAYLPESGAVVQQEEVSDWAGVLARIRRVAEAVIVASMAHLPRVRTGEHCRYCPCKLSCPASQQAVALLAPADGITAAEGERLAVAYNAAVHLRRVLPIVEERAKLLARDGLLPGWRLAQRERREINATVAHRQVAEVYGLDIADAACPRECSQSTLRSALREVAAQRQLGAEVDEMMGQIEQAGGVRRTAYEILERDE